MTTAKDPIINGILSGAPFAGVGTHLEQKAIIQKIQSFIKEGTYTYLSMENLLISMGYRRDIIRNCFEKLTKINPKKLIDNKDFFTYKFIRVMPFAWVSSKEKEFYVDSFLNGYELMEKDEFNQPKQLECFNLFEDAIEALKKKGKDIKIYDKVLTESIIEQDKISYIDSPINRVSNNSVDSEILELKKMLKDKIIDETQFDSSILNLAKKDKITSSECEKLLEFRKSFSILNKNQQVKAEESIDESLKYFEPYIIPEKHNEKVVGWFLTANINDANNEDSYQYFDNKKELYDFIRQNKEKLDKFIQSASNNKQNVEDAYTALIYTKGDLRRNITRISEKYNIKEEELKEYLDYRWEAGDMPFELAEKFEQAFSDTIQAKMAKASKKNVKSSENSDFNIGGKVKYIGDEIKIDNENYIVFGDEGEIIQTTTKDVVVKFNDIEDPIIIDKLDIEVLDSETETINDLKNNISEDTKSLKSKIKTILSSQQFLKIKADEDFNIDSPEMNEKMETDFLIDDKDKEKINDLQALKNVNQLSLQEFVPEKELKTGVNLDISKKIIFIMEKLNLIISEIKDFKIKLSTFKAEFNDDNDSKVIFLFEITKNDAIAQDDIQQVQDISKKNIITLFFLENDRIIWNGIFKTVDNENNEIYGAFSQSGIERIFAEKQLI